MKNNLTNTSFQIGLITASSLLQLHFEQTEVITVGQLGNLTISLTTRKPKLVLGNKGEGNRKSYLSGQWLAKTYFDIINKQHS